jgi:hypothetical protein
VVKVRKQREKKEKVAQVAYVAPVGAAWVDANGKLTAWPDDFKSTLHKALKGKDFADECVYLNAKADKFEKLAKKFRADAEESKRLGGIKGNVKAKKLVALQKRMADLKASLAAEGIDVAELLSKLVPPADAEANGATATAK